MLLIKFCLQLHSPKGRHDKRIKIQKYNHICKNSYGYITGDISKHNIKSKIFENVDKYKKENKIKDVDVILATPPCQGISVANHKKKNELNLLQIYHSFIHQ